MKRSDYQAVSLFSGIGGLDYGALLAGIPVVLSVDNDELALDLHSRAISSHSLIADIDKLNPLDIAQASGIRSFDTSILIAGPPCTGFSHAGFWLEAKRNGKDEQVNRLFDCVSYLRAVKPIAFVIENVPGILFRNYRHILNRFFAETQALGYEIAFQTLNSADYGVPQRRRRVFFVGTQTGQLFRFPKPKFGSDNWRSSGWAFSDLDDAVNPNEYGEEYNGKHSDLLELVPPGDNYLFFTKKRGYPTPHFKWRSRYWSFLLKLDPKQPSPTIPAQRIGNQGPFHWNNRRLRIREIARLQSFPDNYPLESPSRSRSWLGNAVPPLLAAQVFWQLRIHLSQADTSTMPIHLENAIDHNASASEVSKVLGSMICSV